MTDNQVPGQAGEPPRRTLLASERTRMAAERTLMAWIRTALAMIGFGFTLSKFFEYLRQTEGRTGPFVHGPRLLGLTFIALGTVAILGGQLEYHAMAKRLSLTGAAYRRFPFLFAAAVTILGILTFMGIVWRVGPF